MLIFSLFLNLWSCLSLATVSELNCKSPNPSFLSALCLSFLVLKSYWLGTLAELLLNLPIICIPDALFTLAALLISLHFQQVASQKHADRCRRKSNTCHKIWPMISCLLGITSADNACCSQGSHSAQNQCYILHGLHQSALTWSEDCDHLRQSERINSVSVPQKGSYIFLYSYPFKH